VCTYPSFITHIAADVCLRPQASEDAALLLPLATMGRATGYCVAAGSGQLLCCCTATFNGEETHTSTRQHVREPFQTQGWHLSVLLTASTRSKQVSAVLSY
jgi:hypothetical protein